MWVLSCDCSVFESVTSFTSGGVVFIVMVLDTTFNGKFSKKVFVFGSRRAFRFRQDITNARLKLFEYCIAIVLSRPRNRRFEAGTKSF